MLHTDLRHDVCSNCRYMNPALFVRSGNVLTDGAPIIALSGFVIETMVRVPTPTAFHHEPSLSYTSDREYENSKPRQKTIFPLQKSQKQQTCCAALLIPLKGTLTTLVENRHGFIRRSDLDLHKEGLTVLTFGARSTGTIDILPRRFAAQDVIGCHPTTLRIAG